MFSMEPYALMKNFQILADIFIVKYVTIPFCVFTVVSNTGFFNLKRFTAVTTVLVISCMCEGLYVLVVISFSSTFNRNTTCITLICVELTATNQRAICLQWPILEDLWNAHLVISYEANNVQQHHVKGSHNIHH